MQLRSINTCLNCENLIKEFICSKHNQKVEINNFCESHTYKDSITKDSTCTNCSNYGRKSCSKPSEASSKMVCFDWEK
tara:strand:+ start:255 stop:488 length:234 start_codon:yes stop_codon:yes gene_type:complete